MTKKSVWLSWDLKDWNQFLVDLFFRCHDSQNAPIHSFDASDDHLISELTPDSPKLTKSPQETFLEKYVSSLSVANRPFRATGDWASWTPQSSDLPFFYQLYFSLIVATATNRTVEEGDFRKRLAQMLDLPYVLESSVQLIPWMWEQTAKWTESQIENGRNIRLLTLPNPGHETIIGYSKRLAFPCYLDRKRLINILYQSGLTSQSSTNELLRQIGSKISTFSPFFQSEYEILRRDFEKNRKSARESSLWRVLQSINVFDLSIGNRIENYRFLLELDLSQSPCMIETIVNKSAKNLLKEKFHCETQLFAEEEMAYRLVADINGGSDKSSAQEIFCLSETVSTLLSGSYLVEQIEQGFMCFTQIDRFTWTPSRGLPENEEIDVCIVALGELARKTLSDLAPIPENGIDSLDDWYCFGPVKSSRVAKLRRRFVYKDLAALKCSMSNPSFHLIGAVRLLDGILFLPPVLPTVAAPDADSVSLRVRGSDEAIELKKNEELGEFQFTREDIHRIDLPCSVTVSAYRQDSLIGNRNRQFIASCLVPSLREPSSKTSWLEASSTGQLRPWGALGSELMMPNNAADDIQINRMLRMIQSGDHGEQSSQDIQAQYKPLHNIPKQWSDLFESLVGKFSAKCGVSWGEISEVVGNASLTPFNSEAETIELLIQNGHLQKVHNRRWKGVRIFSDPPKIYVRPYYGATEVQIHGLVSISQRNAIQEFADKLRVNPEIAVIGDWDSVGIIRMVIQEKPINKEALLSLQIELKVSPCETHLISPKELLRQKSNRTDLNSPTERLFWNFKKSCFLPEAPSHLEFFLEELRFENTRPCYALKDRNSTIWTTESREWALFLAHHISDEFRGKRVGLGFVGFPTPLPNSLSRYFLHFGFGACGLKKTPEFRVWSYGISDQEILIQWLNEWGYANPDQELSEAMSHWIASISNSTSKDSLSRQSAFISRFASRKN